MMDSEQNADRQMDIGPIYPFRWDIARRSQLGQLVGEPSADRDSWLDWPALTVRSYRWHSSYSYAWFTNELALCAARILALCDNSDLYFVGRSPESLFDYLSGLLFDSTWRNRLVLLHFSTGNMSEEEIAREHSDAIGELRRYLAWLELDPPALASRDRPVAFVDLVASGHTLGVLTAILYHWCNELRGDWNAVRRKIRVVGLTERQETSPKTFRWQQHVEWVKLLAPGSVKNVSIPDVLFHFLGGAQAKVTRSFIPRRWGDPAVRLPSRDGQDLHALKVAAALFDDGRERASRARFASELSKQPAMQHAWFRGLVRELRSSGKT